MTAADPMQAAIDILVDCHGMTEDDARQAMTDAMRPTPIDETWKPIMGRDLGDRIQLEREDGQLSPPIPWDAGAIASEIKRRTDE